MKKLSRSLLILLTILLVNCSSDDNHNNNDDCETEIQIGQSQKKGNTHNTYYMYGIIQI